MSTKLSDQIRQAHGRAKKITRCYNVHKEFLAVAKINPEHHRPGLILALANAKRMAYFMEYVKIHRINVLS